MKHPNLIIKIILTIIAILILNSIVPETAMNEITQIIIINAYINRAGVERDNKVKVLQIKHMNIPEIILIRGKGTKTTIILVKTTHQRSIHHIHNMITPIKGEKIGKRMKIKIIIRRQNTKDPKSLMRIINNNLIYQKEIQQIVPGPVRRAMAI